MTQPEFPGQPEAPRTALPEQDLSTAVLTLPSPVYHGNMGWYYRDATRYQAPPVVSLLSQLREQGIDREATPVIGEYTGQRPSEVYVDTYDQAVARAIVDQASEAGLRVTVASGRAVYGELEQPKDSRPKAISLGGLRRVVRRAGHGLEPAGPAISYDFHLRISRALDTYSQRQDFKEDTMSYTRINHTISLVPSTTDESGLR